MTVSINDFLQAVGQLPNVSADDVTKAVESLPPEKRSDLASVAQALVNRKLLTRAQVNSVYTGVTKQPSTDAASTAVAQDSGINPLSNIKRRPAGGSSSETTRLRSGGEATDVARRASEAATPTEKENLTLPIAAVVASALLLVGSIAFAVVRFQTPSAAAPSTQVAAKSTTSPTSEPVIDPNAPPEVRAVSWVLSQQGSVLVRPEGLSSTLRVGPGGHLPDKPVAIVGVTITESGRIADGRLEPLSVLKGLESVDVHDTGVADTGLGDLASAAGLTTLSIANTAVTNAGIARLKDFPKLQRLDLIGLAKVNDASVPGLASLKNLQHLNVSETNLTPDGVATLVVDLPKCQVVYSLSSASVSALVAAKKEATKTTAPTATPAPAAAPLMPAPEVGQVADVIKLIDTKRDLIEGSCKVEGSQLELSSDQGARLRIPIATPEEYVLTIMAERISGEDGLGIVLHLGRSEVRAVLGAANNRVNGLEPVDGSDYERNSTGRNVPAFVESGPSTFIVHVNKNHVRISRDDVLLVDWGGDPKRLITTKRSFGDFANGLGLTTSAGTGFRISKLDLAVPRKSERPEQPGPAAPRLAPTFVPGQPIDLLSAIDPTRDAISGSWQVDDLGLISPDEPARLQIPIVPPSDYALVVEAERMGTSGFVMGLVVGGNQCGITPDYRRHVGLMTLEGRTPDADKKAKIVDLYRDRQRHTAVCIVRDNHVQLLVDGAQYVDWTGFARKLGVPHDMRVPERNQLWLGTYSSYRITRYDLIPLADATVVGPLVHSRHVLPDHRPKLPDDDAQQAAKKAVIDQFRNDFAKSRLPPEKLALAHKLYTAFFRSQKDADTRFGMLDQAQDLASDNGDVWLAERTITAMAESYQVDGLAAELELLPKMTPKAKGSQTNRDLAEAALQLVDLLAAADRFDDAKRALDVALSATRKSQDAAFTKYVTDRSKQFTAAKAAFDPVAKAAVTLQSDPSNAEAHLAIGRNRCFDHYDWSGGLPHLVKGSDATLADLASRSLKTPFDAESTAKMADAWWDAAEANSSQRNEWILGARYFYRLALPGQTTTDGKKHIEERLAEIAKLRGADTSLLPSTIDLAIAPGEVMRFRLVPAGDFEMGSSAAKTKAALPHAVKITKPFYMSTTEVTQVQYELVMATKPTDVGAQYPYFGEDTKAAWADADTFCKKLNALPAFAAYQSRLPTEAEWEYAARAGSTANYSFGDDAQMLPLYAVFGRQEPEPVGTLRPNGVGLFDVQGNVSEWCSDWESTTYYASSPPEDPTGPAMGKERAYRGGQFNSAGDQCLVWERKPGSASKLAIGIRVVLGL